jgi:uncharacterized protein (UPF0332 family)
MKPETADYLGKARHCLASAKAIAAAEVPDVAAREAYLAVYHAASAYIFERTDKAAKTHRGVISAGDAASAINIAGRFIETIAQVLGSV